MGQKKPKKTNPLKKLYNKTQELIKEIWVPITGIIGAILLINQLIEIWNGNPTRLNYIAFWVLVTIWLLILTLVTFGNNNERRRSFFTTRIQLNNQKFLIYKIISSSLLATSLLGIVLGIILFKNKETEAAKKREEKIIIVIALFDGPEERYGIRNQIAEQLNIEMAGFNDIEVITPDVLIKPTEGSGTARELGKQHQADIVIWGWYKPTENPNITLHVENLSISNLDLLKESEIYQPSVSLEELESFELQHELGSEISALVSFLSGFVQYEAGNYDAALSRFEKAIMQKDWSTNFVNQRDIFFYTANSYLYLDEHDEAILYFELTIETDPNYLPAYNNLGTIYYDSNEYNNAIKYYSEVVHLDPENDLAHYKLGFSYKTIGDYNNAIIHYTKAIGIDDDENYADYRERGVSYQALGEYEKAIKDLNNAIDLKPDNDILYFWRGRIYVDLEDYEKAIADLDKAIDLKPDNDILYLERGRIYADLEDYEKAIADLNKAIDLKPDNDILYFWRGRIYVDLEDYEKAIADLDKAINLDSNNAAYYYTRGFTHHKFEQYIFALPDFTKAIELDAEGQEDASDYCMRGDSYRLIGNNQAAIADYKRCIGVDADKSWTDFANTGLQIIQDSP